MQIDSLRGLLGIRRKYEVPNERIRELCVVTKGVDVRTDESVLRWLGYKERIAMRVFVRECMGRISVGRPRKRWIDS